MHFVLDQFALLRSMLNGRTILTYGVLLMTNDDEPGPAADSDDKDSDTFEGALGRTLGGAAVIFALLVAVGAIAWLIFR